jgi:cytochrome c556
MNRRFILIIILIALVITDIAAFAQQQHRPYNLIMKDIQPAFAALRKDLDGNNGAAAAEDAAKLQALFTEVQGFWAPFDTQDAVGFAKRAGEAAATIGTAAKANDIKAAQASLAVIQKTCASCHFAHREETAKGFLIRP